MSQWNDPIPMPRDWEARRDAAKEKYGALDRRGKLLADLRALADGPGHTAHIIGCAADEIELLVKELEGSRTAGQS